MLYFNFISKIKLNHPLWLLLTLLSSMTAMSTELEENNHTAELGYDIQIKMNLAQAPALNQITPLTFEVSSVLIPIKQVQVEILLTDGLELTKRFNPDMPETLAADRIISNTIYFLPTQAGQHKITLKVTGKTESGVFKDRYEYVYFTTNTNKNLNQMNWPQPIQVNDHDLWSPSARKERFADEDGFISLPAADENLNEVIIKMPAQDYYSTENRGGNQVTINGRYRFRNRENNANIGYYRNAMRLVNATSGDHLAWTYSDNEGYFTFPSVTNPGADGMTVRAYAVRYLNGKGYGVCEYPACVNNAAADSATYDQFYYRQTNSFVVADGNQDIGTYTSSYNLSNSLRALWIKYDMDLAYLHLLQNSSIRGPFTAEWAGDSSHGNHYHRDGNIHFKADVGDGTNHTVLHELGHNVMNNAGHFPEDSDCPSPHFINKISGPQCAWTEGWGHIFLTFVNNEPKKCSPPSTTNCTFFETDPSYDNCAGDWDCGIDADYVEGHVAGAVWDLYDAADDEFDIEQFNLSQFYNIIENDTNDSFVSWWVSWLNDGNSDLALNSLFQNNIIYGDAYDIRVSSPSVNNANPNINETITAQVTIRNLGDISSIATPINFYLSTNSVISNADLLLGTEPHGVLNKNFSVFKTHQFSVDHEANYYVGACFMDVYGFDGSLTNNCSTGVAINVTDSDVIFRHGFE